MTGVDSPIRFADIGDVRIAYRIAGHGPAVLLVHGAEADHTMFDGLMSALSTHHTVISYDQRDSGQTTNPARPYDLVDLASDAASLIEHLGFDRVHVFGTSLGGAIAQVLASRHPHRVERLVLASTWRVGERTADFNPDAAADLALLRGDVQLNAPTIARYFFTKDYLHTHPEAVEIFRSRSRTDAQRARRAHMQAHPPLIDLKAVQSPTLLLAGSADRLIPATHTFALVRELPHAECVLIDGVPHVGAIEAPRRIADNVSRFLGREAYAAGDGTRAVA